MTKYRCSLFCSFFKGEKFVQGYIDNMLEQTCFDDVEFIFLDCDSPENEKKYLLPLINQYSNIKYYRLDSDPGLYAGWNIAVKKCSASIIGNWNIDDRKNKEGLEILINKFYTDPSLDVAYGFTYVSNAANEKYIDNNYLQIYPYLQHTFENLLRNNSPHCMPLWKRSLHDRFGYFNESYRTASDGDFWLRCAVGGAIIKMINHPVGLYYNNPNGRSSNPDTLRDMVSEVVSMRTNYTKYIGAIK